MGLDLSLEEHQTEGTINIDKLIMFSQITLKPGLHSDVSVYEKVF